MTGLMVEAGIVGGTLVLPRGAYSVLLSDQGALLVWVAAVSATAGKGLVRGQAEGNLLTALDPATCGPHPRDGGWGCVKDTALHEQTGVCTPVLHLCCRECPLHLQQPPSQIEVPCTIYNSPDLCVSPGYGGLLCQRCCCASPPT